MEQQSTMTISLELAVIDDDLSGRATTAGQPVKDFTGWIGLMTAIETLLAHGVSARASGGEARSESDNR